jgi:CubicO group peptidase (beta-lactamase class C family)
MSRFRAALLVIALWFPGVGAASSPPDFSGLARLIERTKAETAFPTGTAVAIVQNGRIVYAGDFGHADLRAGLPVGPDTRFYIASATKPFTALTALIQEERGVVDTATSLRDMFPEAAFAGIDAERVTARELLIHTSGVVNAPLVWSTAFSGIHDVQSRRRMVALSAPNPEAPLGRFDYSNVGYNLYSVWSETKTGRAWQRQVTETVLQPLGLSHTTTSVEALRKAGAPLALPYSLQTLQRDAPVALQKVDATLHAAGGLYATRGDLARFLMAQIDRGRVGGRQRLPAAIIERSQQVQTATDGEAYQDFQREGYAWGWYEGPYKGHRMYHHFGSFVGYHAHLSFIPEARIGLVVLNNEDFLSARLTTLIADYVYATLLGEADVEARVSARLDALLGEAGKFDQQLAEHRRRLQARRWQLSQPLAAYAGRYTHPLLGDWIVTMDAGAPRLRWGRLQATATAFDAADEVRVEFAPGSGQVVRFLLDGDRVTGLEFEGIRFER